MYIYLHGLGQTADSWSKIISQLHPDKDVMCPNLADLLKGKDPTYHNLYSSFSAMCDAVEGSLCLCGLSLGGVVALNYAIDHPEKVQQLVLIAAQYKIPEKTLRFQNVLFRFMPDAMFRQMGFDKSGFLKLCRSMMKLDFSRMLYKVSAPTLVICGKKDLANRGASEKLTSLITNSEIEMLDGVGHEVNLEAPERLEKVLCEFYHRNLKED